MWVSLKYGQKGALHMKTHVQLWQYVTEFLLELKMFQTAAVGAVKH